MGWGKRAAGIEWKTRGKIDQTLSGENIGRQIFLWGKLDEKNRGKIIEILEKKS